MAMRSKGYDVMARSSDYGLTNAEIMEYFPGAAPVYISPEEDIDDEELLDLIEKYIVLDSKEGEYGILAFEWFDGASGHAVFYKIEDKKMIIYDGQSAIYEPIDEYYDGHLSNDAIQKSSLEFIRLDNVEPSDDIGKAVVSRKNI